MRVLTLGIVAVVFVAAPASLSAQACVGSHASRGQGFAGVNFDIADDGFGYGVGGGAFTTSSIFFSGGYTRTNLDNSDFGANSFRGNAGFELTSGDVSICPIASVDFTSLTNLPPGNDVDSTILTGGLGLGKTFGESLLFTPYGSAELFYIKADGKFTFGSESASETAASFTAGVSVGSRKFFVTPQFQAITIDGADLFFNVAATVVF